MCSRGKQSELRYFYNTASDAQRGFKDERPGDGTCKTKSHKKRLLKLHTLELMATTIYRFQITKKNSELNRQLIAAMCNEMTHYQDFQVKLYEYGWKPCAVSEINPLVLLVAL